MKVHKAKGRTTKRVAAQPTRHNIRVTVAAQSTLPFLLQCPMLLKWITSDS